jgi:hypothetical protein
MLKRMFFLTIMVGMVGLPYAISTSSEWWKSVSSKFTAAGADEKASAGYTDRSGAPRAAGVDWGRATRFDPTAKHQAIEGVGAQNLEEVLQFTPTPAWVMARWPRVTAGLAELELQGYRVPLVSGTAQDDLAGSLTYYFDREQRVARIVFHGMTGDPRKLIALVTSRYSFERQQADDPSSALFQVKRNGKPQSELRIRPARVVRADQPNARFEVDLAMTRP